MSGVLIFGTGGHAKVGADILQVGGTEVIGFLDEERTGEYFGLPILGKANDWTRFSPSGLVIGIGANDRRHKVAHEFPNARELWINAIHPCATIAPSVKLGRGVVIAAGAVVNPDATIGDHVFINTSASVDHDCRIESFAHLAPGTHLAENVMIEEGAFLGVGCAAIPGVRVGAWATIGAASLVLRDVPANATAVGAPARTIK